MKCHKQVFESLVTFIFRLTNISAYEVFSECGNAGEDEYQYLAVNERNIGVTSG